MMIGINNGYNLLIAWNLIRISTTSSVKIENHSVFPKPTVSCSKSKYCIPLSCSYLDIQYFNLEQDTVGFGKTECFQLLPNWTYLFESDAKLLISYNRVLFIKLKHYSIFILNLNILSNILF